MQHTAHAQKSPLAPGSQLDTFDWPLHSGDTLAIEMPNNSRVKADVIRVSNNILEIQIGEAKLRLAPLSPQETVGISVSDTDLHPISWVVQPS